jgi:hypothetical protein
VIRSAELAEASVERRTAFIKAHLDQMNDAQLTRFEFFVRSHLKRANVRKVMQAAATRHTITDDMAIVAGGLAKLFVGELVETALDVMRERAAVEAQWLAESGQPAAVPSSSTPRQRLTVAHLQEAYRRMQNEGKVGRASLTSGTGRTGTAGGPLCRGRLLHSAGDLEAMCAALAAEEGLDLGDLQAGQEEVEEGMEAAEVTEEEQEPAVATEVVAQVAPGADDEPAAPGGESPSAGQRATKRRRT